MNRHLLESLARRRQTAEADLTRVLESDGSPEELQKCEQELSRLKNLKEYVENKPRPNWLLQLSVVIVALSFILLTSAIPLPRPEFFLDASINAVTLRSAEDGGGLSTSEAIKVKTMEIGGNAAPPDITKQVTSVSSITITPGSSVTFEQEEGCLLISMNGRKSGKAPANDGLTITYLQKDASSSLPVPNSITLPAGTALTLCSDFTSRLSFVGKVSAVEISRMHFSDIYEGTMLRTSSILKGELQLPQVSKTIPLRDSDILSLSEIKNGWAALVLAPQMRVVFSGQANNAHSLALRQGNENGEDLSPTLLQWLTKSTFSTAIFGLTTGLIGMIWTALRYFGFSPR